MSKEKETIKNDHLDLTFHSTKFWLINKLINQTKGHLKNQYWKLPNL